MFGMATSEAPNTEWQMTLSNLSLPADMLLFGSAQQTRDYLQEAGTPDGLFWLPTTRSLLYRRVWWEDKRGTFQNEVDGVRLFGGLQSSYAQPLVHKPELPHPRPIDYLRIRTVQQVQERALMPQVYRTLPPLRFIQHIVGEGEENKLLASLYLEALGADGTYNEHNAPFRRALTISPDLAYKKGFSSVAELVTAAQAHGIGHFIFSTLHSVRPAQDDPNVRLEPWQEWLPELIRNKQLAGVAVSFGRRDLKPPSAALGGTFDQMHEVLRGDPQADRLGDLPLMLEAIRSEVGNNDVPKPLVILHAGAAALKSFGWKPQTGQQRLADFVKSRLGFNSPTTSTPS